MPSEQVPQQNRPHLCVDPRWRHQTSGDMATSCYVEGPGGVNNSLRIFQAVYARLARPVEFHPEREPHIGVEELQAAFLGSGRAGDPGNLATFPGCPAGHVGDRAGTEEPIVASVQPASFVFPKCQPLRAYSSSRFLRSANNAA